MRIPEKVTLVGYWEDEDGRFQVVNGDGELVGSFAPEELGAALAHYARGDGLPQVRRPRPVQSIVGEAAASLFENQLQRHAPGALRAINLFLAKSQAFADALDKMRVSDDSVILRQEARRK